MQATNSRPWQAILLVIFAGFTLAGMDAIGKQMVTELHPVQVTWARFLFHTLIVGFIFRLNYGWRFAVARRTGLQMIRALFLMGITISLYSALQFIQLSDALAIMFFGPVIVTLLAGLILGEKVRAVHYVAAVMGCVGALIIIQPGFGHTHPAMLLALLAASCYALYLLMTRLLRDKDNENTTLFHSTLVGSVVMSLLVPFWWTQPSNAQWFYLVLMGCLGASGHFMLVKAFHLAEASALSPFLNAHLVAATLYSVLFFNDTLEWTFLLGAGIIVAAGLLLWWLTHRKPLIQLP